MDFLNNLIRHGSDILGDCILEGEQERQAGAGFGGWGMGRLGGRFSNTEQDRGRAGHALLETNRLFPDTDTTTKITKINSMAWAGSQ